MNQKLYEKLLVITAIGAGIIYQLPYIKNIFYVPLLTVYSLSNFQIGMLSAIYSLVTIFSYLFGSILISKSPWKNLLSIAFFTTGVVGIFMSFAKNYFQLFFCFAALGITTILFYFSSVMCINNFLYSSLENTFHKKYNTMFRGITSAIIGSFCVICYLLLDGGLLGMRIVILCYALTSIFMGIIVFTVFPHFKKKEGVIASNRIKLLDSFKIMKQSQISGKWILQICVSFSIYILLSAYLPLFVYSCNMPVKISLFIGVIRYFFSAVAIVISVQLTNRFNKEKIMFSSYIAIIFIMLITMLFNKQPSLIPFLIVQYFVMCIIVYAYREFYFSLYPSTDFAPRTYGKVVGIIAFFSYIPEIIIHPLMGYILDKSYNFINISIFTIVLCVLGLIPLFNSLSKGDQ